MLKAKLTTLEDEVFAVRSQMSIAENIAAIRAQMNNAAIAAGELPEGDGPSFVIEVPGDRTHGDLATNVAMVSAKAFRSAPRKIAEAIVAHLNLNGTYFEKVEIAGPGFLNFFLSPNYYGAIVAEAIEKGDAFGRSPYGNGKKVMVK